MWDRFIRADPAAQRWYYQSLAASYQGRVPSALPDELSQVIGQMRSLGSTPTATLRAIYSINQRFPRRLWPRQAPPVGPRHPSQGGGLSNTA